MDVCPHSLRKKAQESGLESGLLSSETPKMFLALIARKPMLQSEDLPTVSQPVLSSAGEGWCSVPTPWAVPSISSSSSVPPAAPPSPFSPDGSSPLLQMPAEFFHPAVSASQKGQEPGMSSGTLPKIALQGSWASLRSPSVNCTLLRQVQAPPGFCRVSWSHGELGAGEGKKITQPWHLSLGKLGSF